MSREAAVNSATGHFDTGAFKADLARRVAIPTDSRDTARVADLRRYIDTEMLPALEAMGFACRVLTHPRPPGRPSSSRSASRILPCRPCSATATAT